jgi:ADP-ribose pyrophosphatase YjhB (NUDIX family)
VEQPGTWGTWGGAIDEQEDPADAVKREVQEEAGYSGPLRLIPLRVFRHPSGFRYHNFLALVPQEFEPQLNWETQGSRWFEPGHWPQPLHPGMVSLLQDARSQRVIDQASANDVQEDTDHTRRRIERAAIDFYQNQMPTPTQGPVEDYVQQARELLVKAPDSQRDRVLAVLRRAKKNPYIQGGVITAVGALLAGAALTSAQRMGLTPTQTNMLLQALLNTVIPTMVSRVNGRNWRDTIKYTLASMGVGTGIAAITERGVDENFADKKIKGKSRPGRVKRAGASCAGSVTDLRKRAKKYGGERGRMYHWCANMKSGRARKNK